MYDSFLVKQLGRVLFLCLDCSIIASSIYLSNMVESQGEGSGGQTESKVYGSCEGPDSMYVKLISGDVHEFIIKREHAQTSGIISLMLSVPGLSLFASTPL